MKDQLEALVAQMYSSGILYSEAVREFKKRFIMNVLQQNRGNQCKAARELGMHRNTLSRTIAELKLDVRQLRDGGRRPVRSEKPPVLDKQKLVRKSTASHSTPQLESNTRCSNLVPDPAGERVFVRPGFRWDAADCLPL